MDPVREVLLALGARPAEIEAADEHGTLLALAAERFLLPGERRFDTADVAAEVGVDAGALTKLWLALGFPQPAGEKAFSDTDVDVVRTFLRDETAIDDYWLHEARVISASLGRIAEVFVDEIWDQHFSAGQSEREALSEIAGTPIDLERMERMLLYVLRRHLVAVIYRRLALSDQAARSGAPSIAVGFADLAGYSSLSRDMTAAELTRLVVSFEKATYDLVAERGGRVVKTLGDGLLFTADDALSAADIALRLADLAHDDLPPVRVGLGWGPVLIRQGDCFGPTVNLISRVVAYAGRGEVAVEPAMAAQLAADARFSATPIGRRDLKGFGAVVLSRLHRVEQGGGAGG